jgi:cytochrome c oxidase assembly protein subunit 15
MFLQLALTGLLVAQLPLMMVWRSRETNKYRKLVWVTVVLTFELIMFGAFTRLTDSGLGCPDWPGCYGHANPVQAHEHISAAEAAMPTGPVTAMKAWIEMIHRYLAMSIGVLIIVLVAIAWVNWIRSQRRNAGYAPWYPMLLLGFICLQGAFGAWTVTMKLQPIIVTTHLLLGMGLLALLTWLAMRQSEQTVVGKQAIALRLPALAAAIALVVQLALGGWVSTNYAALACTEFPLCNGALVPQMDLGNGFTLWRELGRTAAGEFLPFPALVAVHWVHRSFAFVVIALVTWVGWRARTIPGLEKSGRWLLIAVAAQFLTGVSTIFLNFPLLLAVAHNGGAALLVLLLTMVNYKARSPIRSATPSPVGAASVA